MRNTRTYAVMKVSTATFQEVKAKLEEAGYDQALHNDDKTLDMHGVALEAENPDIPGRQVGSIGGLDTP